MRLLFDDDIAPITSSIGFLETNYKYAVEAYEMWMGPILVEHGFRFEKKPLSGDLESMLLKLEPLVSPIRTKYLFIPTDSAWTAFFDNGWQGSDTSAPMSVLSGKLNCRGLSVTAIPNTMPSKVDKNTKGRYGATIMELYGPNGEFVRTIAAINDGGKWVFEESGEPLDFENVEAYKAKKKVERFTTDMLDNYLKKLGIRAFNESFYLPKDNDSSIFLNKVGTYPSDFKEYSLNEVRKFNDRNTRHLSIIK